MKKTSRIAIVHAVIIVLMFAVSCVYFRPVFDGKVVMQGDIMKFESMIKESKDFHEATGEYAYWNSSMFSGMPSYTVGATRPQQSVANFMRNVLDLHYFGWERNIGVLFMYLVGFYVALMALGLSPLMALLGALAFGLGSYNIIIVEAGHISKAWALSMVAPVFAGMILCLRKKGDDKKSKYRDYVAGGILFALALSVQLGSNHVQITYYTVIGAVCLGLVHLIFALKEKRMKSFVVGGCILLLGSAVAFGCNARTLLVTQQYSKQTMRGGNVITITPEDLYKDGEPETTSGKTSGLNMDYAFSWSYGIGETYTLLVPGASGGGSGETVGKNSASYKAFHHTTMPLYWGDQPFTSGPVYFGAVVMFLFLMGAILVKGPERWWLIVATILSVMMSWGRNFQPFNEWLFNTLPLYNKFRTPSMSLILANVTAVLLGMLGLRQFVSSDVAKKRKMMALYVSAGVTMVTLLIGMIVGGNLSYSGASDVQMAAQYGDQWSRIQDVFIQDRKALFMHDSWRSLIFVLLAGVSLWASSKMGEGKKYTPAVLSVVLMVLVVADLWSVDRRYLNEKNFVRKSSTKIMPDAWDDVIDRYAAQNGDEDYRVLNLAVNTFNDSKPSAIHHQIGGYSAAKMRRYQDIIDFYMGRHINPQVLNMLNARYIVLNNGQVQRNPDALGNCWLVSEVQRVDNANDEILALKDLDPSQTAVVNENEFKVPTTLMIDSTDVVEMEHQKPYNPNYLCYKSRLANERLVVFSEIYYKPDWYAYIDGKKAEYVRVNYLLRGMVVPAGEHKIEFRNEAPLFKKMDKVALCSSIVLVLLVAGGVVLYVRKRKTTEPAGQDTKQK